jgi:hypothetical protein
MIKQKRGICIDCPPESKEVPLTAKRCNTHYWRYRQQVNSEKPSSKAKKAEKGTFAVFFASQALVFPDKCEESGQPLPKSPAWLKLSCIAHILPKKKGFGGFPSVATHPSNKIFLHPDIHSNMDNLGKDYVVKMKSLHIMKERVKVLLPFLTDEERNRVPEYLL